MNDEEPAFIEAGAQVDSTLEEIGRAMATATASFAPHVEIAQGATDRGERIRAYRDAAGPVSRYADRLVSLERSLRDQIEVYTQSFESRFQRPEVGTDTLVPMLEGNRASAASYRADVQDQRAAAALIRDHNVEPHLTDAFGRVVTALDRISSDADAIVTFAERLLARLKGG